MYASMTIATEQIRQHHATAAAAGRARQIRRARRRTQAQPSAPQRRRAHLRVVA